MTSDSFIDVKKEPFYAEGKTELPREHDIIHDKYLIMNFITNTYYSIVFEGKNILTGALVATKFIKRRNDDHLSKITNEIDIMQKFDDKQIMKLLDSFLYKEYVCIVTPFAEYGSLKKIIKDNYFGIPEEKAIPIMKQMAESVKILHHKNICHRDIKPDNFLIMDQNENNIYLVLGDFGLSEEHMTNEGLRGQFGTYDYTAPEVFEDLTYSDSIDIWSLGVSFFEIVTGKPPFPKYEVFPGKCISSIKSGSVNDFWLNEAVFSLPITEMIKKMLSKDPKERPTIDEITITLSPDMKSSAIYQYLIDSQIIAQKIEESSQKT